MEHYKGQKKLESLRACMDFVSSAFEKWDLEPMEMIKLAQSTRKYALDLFPEKEQTYDLIYKPLLDNQIREKLCKN